ncbi:MAG: cation diffusion facilitator family transporter [Treponema sp.]|nr:cation diffusion facilitator family transporter [Treponema sp.]
MGKFFKASSDSDINRERKIVRTSSIGIATNIFLATFKASVGILSHSIAITLDAINNLSDAASSLITIVGTKLAGKAPDKKHPFGYGRIEYLSAMVISIIVLYAGITSLTESIKKIIKPDIPEYTSVSLFIVGTGVIIKILLGRFVKKVGIETNSASLVNSGEDATLDAVISASTLVAAFLYIWKNISIEAWLGAVISLFIIKAGIEMLHETISKVLGERADPDLSSAIKKTVLSFKDVSGAYDLVLNNYGPDSFNGSIHIEIPDTYSAGELDELIRAITSEVYEKHNVILTAVGIYSVNTKNDSSAQMRDKIFKLALAHEHVLQLHGFYVSEKSKTIRCDIVISFDAPDRRQVQKEVCSEIQKLYPDYQLEIAIDIDFSE